MGSGVLLLAMVACGGSTSSSEGTGGTSSGGTSGGGTSSGGTSGGGTSSGGTSSGGTGNVSGLDSCSGPGTCVLFATNCCGGYCDPAAPLSGYQAVNEQKVTELEATLCTGDIMCPGCVSVDNPANLALCRGQKCQAVDLKKDALSACQSDADCRLRWGSDCCEDCAAFGTDNLISYSASQNLEAEVCKPGGGACPPCAPPPYPKSVLPVCGPDKHCTWTLVGP